MPDETARIRSGCEEMTRSYWCPSAASWLEKGMFGVVTWTFSPRFLKNPSWFAIHTGMLIAGDAGAMTTGAGSTTITRPFR